MMDIDIYIYMVGIINLQNFFKFSDGTIQDRFMLGHKKVYSTKTWQDSD